MSKHTQGAPGTNVVTYRNQPVATTEILARYLGANETNITSNYGRNQERFVEGKHLFKISYTEAKDLQITLGDLHKARS